MGSLLWTGPRREWYSLLIWRLPARRVGRRRLSSVIRPNRRSAGRYDDDQRGQPFCFNFTERDIPIMPILFGTPLAGTVDRVDHESIKTRFLVIIIPLIPLGSFLITSESASFRLNSGVMKGIPIKLNLKSVLIGYLRMYCWVPSLIYWETDIGDHLGMDSLTRDYTGIALFVVCFCVTMFGLGRLSKAEKLRRRQLREATGYGLDADQITLPPNDVGRGFPVVSPKEHGEQNQ
jgi:hypothetical protein